MLDPALLRDRMEDVRAAFRNRGPQYASYMLGAISCEDEELRQRIHFFACIQQGGSQAETDWRPAWLASQHQINTL